MKRLSHGSNWNLLSRIRATPDVLGEFSAAVGLRNGVVAEKSASDPINEICRLRIFGPIIAAPPGFASKVRLFKISVTPGFSPVIGSWKKIAKPF